MRATVIHVRRNVLSLAFMVWLLRIIWQTDVFAGTVVAWGDNTYGQTNVPAGLTNVIAVAGGGHHSLALNADGTVVSWGYNAYGQASVPGGLTNVVAISAGYLHSLALKSDGTVVAWGHNAYGQTNVPQGLSNVVAIAGGGFYNLVLRRDGSLAAWGNNYDDIGNYVGEGSVPAGLSNVVAISAGGYHNAVLNGDSTVFTWGETIWEGTVPSGLSNVVAAGSGNIYSAALKSDGSVTTWGGGIPAPPPGLHFISIAAGGAMTFGLEANGTVVGWGDNSSGELLIPSGLTNVTAVSAGDYSGLALVGDGPPLASTGQLVLLTLPVTGAAQEQSSAQTVVGRTVQLVPAGIGGLPMQYQWQFGTFNSPASKNSPLVLTNVQFAQAGDYLLSVSNVFGLANTSTVHLTVAPLEITFQPESQAVLSGTDVVFNVTVDGLGPFAYQWQFNGTNLLGATNAALTLTNVFPQQSGAYSVLVSNSYGSLTSSNALLVAIPFQIVVQPQSQFGLAGTNIELDVSAVGNGLLHYQWQFNGTNIAGATNIALILPSVTTPDSGTYSASISNSYGLLTSSNAVLTVAPSIILAQPRSQSGYAREAALEFTVTVAGQGPFGYQWQFNGEDILGATNSFLSLTNLDWSQVGLYSVVISNVYGVVTSENATLQFSQIAPWGDNSLSQGTVPADLTNVVVLSSGYYHGLALTGAGTLAAWGYNGYGQAIVPAGLSNVVGIAAGGYHNLVVKSDGTVVAWGAGETDDGLYSPTFKHGQCIIPSGLSNVIAVAGGEDHSLALKSNGTVTAWGWNLSGQVTVPAGLSNVTAIAAGGYHSLALRSDGTVIGWGYNHDGELNMPVGLSNVIAVAAGYYFSLALKADGTMVAWGDNSAGQCSVPVGLSNLVAIAAGGWHGLALRADGVIFAWGASSSGQVSVPPTLTNVVAVSAGYSNSFALLGYGPPFVTLPAVHLTILGGQTVYFPTQTTGTKPITYQWQRNGVNLPNANGALLSLVGTQAVSGAYSVTVSNIAGMASSSTIILTVIPLVITNSPINQTVLAGTNVVLTVGATGWTPLNYQWLFNGTNLPGATNASLLLTNVQPPQSGSYSALVGNAFGNSASSNALLTVLPLSITRQPQDQSTFLGGSASFSVTAALQGPFSYQWQLNGANISGATQNPFLLSNLQFTQAGTYSVLVNNSLGFTMSSNAMLAISQFAAWGLNSQGQASQPQGVNTAVAIAAGGFHNLALKADGSVVAWGYNGYGQASVPAGLSNILAIAAGYYHSLALKGDGTVVAWGNNAYGQANVPAGLSNVVRIAAGYYHNLALKSGGTVVAWGNNVYGQSSVSGGLSNVVGIAAGQFHSLALKGDSTVVAWGNNTYGQATVPTGLSNVVGLAAGQFHSLALKIDGTMVAWGNNMYGQARVPTGLSNVVAIAGGGFHSLALKNDGTVAAWGLNAYGQASVPSTLGMVEAISAGFYHSLALVNDGAPYVIRQPVGRTTYAGSDVTINLAACGAPAIHYQWQLNGTDMDSATNTSLVLTNVPLSSAGTYECEVSNARGTITSLPAFLSVLRTTPRFGGKPQFGSGGFGFQLNGLSGHGDVVLFASTNVVNWVPILTNPPVLGTLQLIDPSATNLPLRFYRAVEQ